MQIFVVGGAVRDVLLGLNPTDIDFCVVGSTRDEMIELGFNPIEASSFPVFHNKSGQEFALARTEKKSGSGYHGFEIDTENVTLIDDLFRRDLTINSMAVHIENWETFKSNQDISLLIDPHNGLKSIADKKVKHTSKHFVDDPVRAIRAVRLANKLHFVISDSTKNLIKSMVNDKQLEHLTSERIWLELEKVLKSSSNISQFFVECEQLGISESIFPLFDNKELFINHNDLHLYNNSNIDSVEYAFLAMVNSNSFEYIEHFCKYLTIPLSYLKIFKIYIILQKYFYNDQDEPTLIINCLYDLNIYKNFTDVNLVINFYILIEKNNENRCKLLINCYKITKNINFTSLNENQQKNLKCKNISNAIKRLKIDTVEEYIKEINYVN